MSLVIAIAALAAAGAFLVARRGTVRLVLGFILLGHAVNLLILAAGGANRREPAFISDDLDTASVADPLPQAFVLTAIVITFGVTVFLLALTAKSRVTGERNRARTTQAEDEDAYEDEDEEKPA
jgi:multicomponent Na+:H+ antiporter subunit C